MHYWLYSSIYVARVPGSLLFTACYFAKLCHLADEEFQMLQTFLKLRNSYPLLAC